MSLLLLYSSSSSSSLCVGGDRIFSALVYNVFYAVHGAHCTFKRTQPHRTEFYGLGRAYECMFVCIKMPTQIHRHAPPRDCGRHTHSHSMATRKHTQTHANNSVDIGGPSRRRRRICRSRRSSRHPAKCCTVSAYVVQVHVLCKEVSTLYLNTHTHTQTYTQRARARLHGKKVFVTECIRNHPACQPSQPSRAKPAPTHSPTSRCAKHSAQMCARLMPSIDLI